nr:malate dehydrogenase, chloroplastic isoform X2 [Arachis hypogaea]
MKQRMVLDLLLYLWHMRLLDSVKLGGKQVEALIPSDLQGLTEYEQKVLEALKPKLKAGIEKGIGFSHKQMVFSD